MRKTFANIFFWIGLLTGIGLLYLGINFIVNPLQAQLNYGINFSKSTDYSFHYIKGIRDFCFGIILIWLLLRKQYYSLGWIFIFSTIIPLADFVIVISHQNYLSNHLVSHVIAIIICLVSGIYYTKNYKS